MSSETSFVIVWEFTASPFSDGIYKEDGRLFQNFDKWNYSKARIEHMLYAPDINEAMSLSYTRLDDTVRLLPNLHMVEAREGTIWP